MSYHLLKDTRPAALDEVSVRRRKICVFCGSSSGANPAYIEAAQALARALAEQDIDLGILSSNTSIEYNPLLRL